MKRILGATLLLLVLTACGDDDGEQVAPDGLPPADTTSHGGDPRVVDIVSGSAAGGTVEPTATLIEDDAALERYLRQFESADLAADLSATVAAHQPEGDRVLGLAVIEISCDEPPSAAVVEDHGVFVVTPGKVVSPHQECVVPVTSVAVIDVAP